MGAFSEKKPIQNKIQVFKRFPKKLYITTVYMSHHYTSKERFKWTECPRIEKTAIMSISVRFISKLPIFYTNT